MIFQGVSFVRLLVFEQEDFEFYTQKYLNTGVIIELSNRKMINKSSLPTICVGKKMYSLVNHLYDFVDVVNSLSEEKSSTEKVSKKIDIIIERVAFQYQPYELFTYDAILNGKFSEFIKSEINTDSELYLYFHGKCLYLYCSGKLISVNLETIEYVYGDFKKEIEFIFHLDKCFIFSFFNFLKYTKNQDGFNPLVTFENVVWCKEQEEIVEKNLLIHFANSEVYRHIPYLMSVYLKQNPIEEDEYFSIIRNYRKDIITNWLNEREIIFDKEIDKIPVKKSKGIFYYKVHYSNKRTITERIMCNDEHFNIQMLPKDSEIRNHIVSRYKNGKIVVFDYISFEARIAVFTTGDMDFISRLQNEDLHIFTSKIIFNKEDITKKERGIGKMFNHTLLFGGGEERLKSILSENLNLKDGEFEFIYNRATEQLSPIIEKSKEIIGIQKDYGKIKNPYGVLIRPRKGYASFNNFIQSTASDIVVEKLYEIRTFIKDRNIKFMYQVFDSFVFDFSESELQNIAELQGILSKANKVSFTVDVASGKNLMECTNKEEE